MTVGKIDTKVALVTGGSRGIGKAISIRLAQDGFLVIVNFVKDQDAANQVCEIISADGGCPKPIAIQADVSDLADAKRLFAEIKQQCGHVSVLVNNAGILGDQLFLLSNTEAWWSVIKTNLGSVVNCTKLALPNMIARKSGIIINITSISGQRGAMGQTAYAASKSAIVGFTKSLVREVSQYGIRINCVSPGLIDTDMIRTVDTEIIEQRVSALLVKRLGQPNEVAEIVSLLASGQISYVTGQVLSIDGGASM